MRGYLRTGWPDKAELVSLLVLGVISIWGVWFGVQSVLTLWWPLNLLYLAAGLVVAAISAAVGRAILIR